MKKKKITLTGEAQLLLRMSSATHTHLEGGDEATYGAVPTLLDDGTYTPYQPPPKYRVAGMDEEVG